MKFTVAILSLSTAVFAGMYDPTVTTTTEPTPTATVHESNSHSHIEIGNLTAKADGDNTVAVGGTEHGAAGSASGMNGAFTAAQATPGSALGLSF